MAKGYKEKHLKIVDVNGDNVIFSRFRYGGFDIMVNDGEVAIATPSLNQMKEIRDFLTKVINEMEIDDAGN